MAAATERILKPSSETKKIEVRVEHGTLHGYVYDEETMLPIKNVRIVVVKVGD